MANNTPHDLSVYVFGRIGSIPTRPMVDTLDSLFQTLFLASLRTEEGLAIKCSVCYVNPKRPDPEPPEDIRDPRWTFTPFSEPIEYGVQQLIKLALATDLDCSTIAVFPNKKGQLYIWGLFDQQGGYQSFLKHETRGGWSPPGILQAQILGVGHIIVTTEEHGIVELNGEKLIEGTINLFQNMNISSKLSVGFKRRIANIQRIVEQNELYYNKDDLDYSWDQWLTILRRILLHAKSFGHGGAFLITDSRSGLPKPKYKIKYDRIPALFEKVEAYEHIENETITLIHESLDAQNFKSDCATCDKQKSAENYFNDATEALTGAISFISTLSRVDGLVLLDRDFVVHGFGCEITVPETTHLQLYSALSPSPTSRGKRRRLDIERYGTRHRSMIRYCNEDEGAIGFVVSNDGPVRAITRIGEAVYMWDNIQLALKY